MLYLICFSVDFKPVWKVQQWQIEETNVVEELTHRSSQDPPLRPAVITHILPLCHTGCFLNSVFQVHLEGREEGSGLMTGVKRRKSTIEKAKQT